MHDPTGDRMKALERASAGAAIPHDHAIYARIDGRGFSRFTRDMQRPFDARMTRAMLLTASHILEEAHAAVVYVQSDEISVLWAPAIQEDGTPGEHFFGGKPQKLCSILAGMATSAFMHALLRDPDGLADWTERMPHFDARVVDMADPAEAVAAIAWRGQDARRNGIRQLASAHFSHRQLQNRGNREVVQMLAGKGIRLSDQPKPSMNGTLLRRQLIERPLSASELDRIPPRHRPAPGALVKRHETVGFAAEHPGRITNLSDVILEGADPVLERRNTAADLAADLDHETTAV